jgi:hypothetical protein
MFICFFLNLRKEIKRNKKATIAPTLLECCTGSSVSDPVAVGQYDGQRKPDSYPAICSMICEPDEKDILCMP